MNVLTPSLLLTASMLVVLLVAVLQWRFMAALRQRITSLQLQLSEKGEQAAAIHSAAIPAEEVSAGRPYVKIEVSNPLAVAEQEAAVGGVAGALAPTLVKKRVYQDLRKQLAQELQARGIAAQVSVQLDVPGGQP